MIGFLSKLFGGGKAQDDAPASQPVAPVTPPSAPAPEAAPAPAPQSDPIAAEDAPAAPAPAEDVSEAPRVVSAEWDEEDQVLITLEVPTQEPRFILRRMHGTRPRSQLMAAADGLDALAIGDEPLGPSERLEADDPVQVAMVAARAKAVESRADD